MQGSSAVPGKAKSGKNRLDADGTEEREIKYFSRDHH